jgi:hypothetical protein
MAGCRLVPTWPMLTLLAAASEMDHDVCNVWKYSCIYIRYENDPLHCRSWTPFQLVYKLIKLKWKQCT